MNQHSSSTCCHASLCRGASSEARERIPRKHGTRLVMNQHSSSTCCHASLCRGASSEAREPASLQAANAGAQPNKRLCGEKERLVIASADPQQSTGQKEASQPPSLKDGSLLVLCFAVGRRLR
ncbi:hypothetical protein DdX_13995 [Ditylenchus destructor]|uniref:Uncharacterized protein n=1 Tax=Ditylenchus destructor TaxID=166010 RepID=A0AAD4R221_9BILA|nr:hypothetical protein DdX_13995 [Ditylenchus destructor]